jgi:monoamine oxidase
MLPRRSTAEVGSTGTMRKNEKSKGLTKREFIKVAATAAMAVATMTARTESAEVAPDRKEYDVIVIGAGFAGVTAARELSMAGHRTLLLEARNRIGGRTFFSKFGEKPVELGGTWIHWAQPHVWAEVMRYGLVIEETPGAAAPERIMWLEDGKVFDKHPAEVAASLSEGMSKFFEPVATDSLPRPYDPFFRPEFAQLDQYSTEERLAAAGLSPAQRTIIGGNLSSLASSPNSNAAYVDMLRVWALSGNDVQKFTDALARYHFRDGTISLISAMLADGKAELRLGTPVSRISQRSNQVEVTTGAGETLVARYAIVTVPMNTLDAIEFAPALNPKKVAASRERHAGAGTKIWIKVRGKVPIVNIVAPDTAPLSVMFTETPGVEGGYMIGFSPSRKLLDPKNRAAIQAHLRRFMPSLEVVEVLNHDWDLDPYSLGTWCAYRPGQATKYWMELRRPEGRVYFASADSALGWRGFIDGAIESGLHTSNLVAKNLALDV